MSEAIVAEAVSVSRGGVLVVADLTFTAGPGAWLGILGANGSGKTTALMGIAGRLAIDSGRLWLAGEESSQDEAARAGRVGFAPPPDSLPGLLTARELLALLARSRGAPPDAPRAVFDALALGPLLDRQIASLSSGMRQRVAIFCAFVGERPVVLLDEPFNWLDPVVAFDLKSALAAAVAGGTLLVTALHDVATLATRCSAGLWLHDGRVAGTFASDELAAAARDLIGFERSFYARFRASG